MECETSIEKPVCVNAEVTVTPRTEVGEVKAFCCGEPTFEMCPCKPSCEDTVIISQMICVKIPITFLAGATAEATGIVCEQPCPEECKPNPCEEDRMYIRLISWRMPQDFQPVRSFLKNILLTYENNPQFT